MRARRLADAPAAAVAGRCAPEARRRPSQNQLGRAAAAQAGQFAEAQAAYERALALDPNVRRCRAQSRDPAGPVPRRPVGRTAALRALPAADAGRRHAGHRVAHRTEGAPRRRHAHCRGHNREDRPHRALRLPRDPARRWPPRRRRTPPPASARPRARARRRPPAARCNCHHRQPRAAEGHEHRAVEGRRTAGRSRPPAGQPHRRTACAARP